MQFATDKGMVLKISSMYPRLGFCRAFDASLLSDYPEEQGVDMLISYFFLKQTVLQRMVGRFRVYSDPQSPYEGALGDPQTADLDTNQILLFCDPFVPTPGILAQRGFGGDILVFGGELFDDETERGRTC